jgi:excisionase family DNA binding protein
MAYGECLVTSQLSTGKDQLLTATGAFGADPNRDQVLYATPMLTVPEAAARTGRNPETIRRWIRSGRLRAHKVGTQHVIEERDLEDVMNGEALPLPEGWRRTSSGEPMPDWVAIIRESRASH